LSSSAAADVADVANGNGGKQLLIADAFSPATQFIQLWFYQTTRPQRTQCKNKHRFYRPILDFYARKQLLLSVRLSHRNSVRSSVCLSVTRVNQSKTVQA